MNLVNFRPLEKFRGFVKSGDAATLLEEIQWHLENDMPGLIQVMYRLDIEEEDFLSAFQTKGTVSIADNICELLLKKIEKIAASRKAYRQDPGTFEAWKENDDDW